MYIIQFASYEVHLHVTRRISKIKINNLEKYSRAREQFERWLKYYYAFITRI